MELKIKPFHKNTYVRRGILIKGNDAVVWLKEVYAMGLDPEAVLMYPLAGTIANQLFGCLVVPAPYVKVKDIGSNSYMQCVNGRLYIPENAILYPELNETEWDKQFTAQAYVMHPETGLTELKEPFDWDDVLQLPEEADAKITVPLKSVYIPAVIRSFSIEADNEELAESIEGQVGSGAKDVPFNIDKVMKGNDKEIDKLLKYLEKNPEMALKLGIPLDVAGASRGKRDARFVFGKTGGGRVSNDFTTIFFILAGVVALLAVIYFLANVGTMHNGSFPLIFLFFIARFIYQRLKQDTNGNGTGGGTAVINNDKFTTLQNHYDKLAKDLIEKKEYQKAAGIYLKLLQNHFRAAQVLEEGGYYAEAGAIYLKYCKDKRRGAECYEKGRLYAQAIDLYKELDEKEKTADLYVLLHNQKEANKYYQMVADDYVKNNQYVKASLIFRKKMNQPLAGQDLLLEGWHKNRDAHNCLNNYFANIEDVSDLETEIKRFYNVELEQKKREAFLQILKIEFHKHNSLKPVVKAMAYEIIVECMEATPFIASELIAFNHNDQSISKDVMRFKSSRVKRN